VVVRKGVNVGDALTPGQTIVTMTQGTYAWITANFKETQLEGVQAGEPVEIDVDAFPGKTFHGSVQSINEASGNTTSLLPADNATGNFTKVVQRIPVKIVLVAPRHPASGDATQQDIEDLRQGMSCEPTIDISAARGK
jgi:membrane fusion protein (multidrug efflux system)